MQGRQWISALLDDFALADLDVQLAAKEFQPQPGALLGGQITRHHGWPSQKRAAPDGDHFAVRQIAIHRAELPGIQVWPDGTGRTLALETDAWRSSRAFPIPSGGSPLGTGQWPVLPTGMATATSEFGLNRAKR